MALVVAEVKFEGCAPTLSQLGEKISGTLGLRLIVREMPDRVKGDLHELHGTIAFACYPKEQIIVHAYRPGGVRRHLERLGEVGGPFVGAVQGADERPGTQTVYVEGFSGMEPTLLLSAVSALRALGGRVGGGLNESMLDRYAVKTTLTELRSRRQKFHTRELVTALGVIVSLPVIIPWSLLWFSWTAITVPLRIRRAVKSKALTAIQGGKSA